VLTLPFTPVTMMGRLAVLLAAVTTYCARRPCCSTRKNCDEALVRIQPTRVRYVYPLGNVGDVVDVESSAAVVLVVGL
jgi:hypothetical protein